MLDSLHFDLKTDKRPDGKKISPVEKVDYINREGKYADLDENRLRSHDIFQHTISSSSAVECYLKRDQMLYESPFGSIKQTADGKIMVSKDASVETISIALAVAMKIYGDKKLSLSSDAMFRGRALVAGRELDLPIRFAEEKLDKKYQAMREEERREREKCNSAFGAGSRILRPENRAGAFVHLPYAQPSTGKIPTLQEKMRMSVLPKRGLEVRRGTGTSMFLHGAPGVLLHDSGAEQDSAVRRDIRGDGESSKYAFDTGAANRERPLWSLGDALIKQVIETANQILANLQKELERTYAYSHIQYINREAAFQQRGGCIGKGHFLPAWAGDDPKKFFEAADLYERANGERYKEIVYALPNELPFEAQKEIVENFIDRELKDHYYAYAIHDKIGAMSDGAHNVHVHIMFTTRKNDEYEKTVGRPPAKFFARANFKNPEKGGCPKAKKWTDEGRNDFLRNELRPVAAEIINEMLVRHGFDYRVSEKSLKARKEKAESDGDAVLAKLLDRDPEEHLDLKIFLRNGEPVDELKARRRLKNAQTKDAYAAELMKNLMDEKQLWDALAPAKAHLDWMLKRKAGDLKTLVSLKKHLDTQSKAMLWTKDSYLAAAQKFMRKDEKKRFAEFLDLCQTKAGLEKMLRNADREKSGSSDDDLALRIKKYKNRIQAEAPKIAEIFARLKKQRLDVLKEQRAMLQKNAATKRNLVAALQAAKDIWTKEAAARAKAAEEKARVYKMSDVRQLLFEQYQKIREDCEVQKALIEELKKKVIPKGRAIAIAASKYTGGATKKVRAGLRELEKRERYLQQDQSSYRTEEFIWKQRGEGNPYRRTDLDAKKADLSHREHELAIKRKELEAEKEQLIKIMSEPDAKAAIEKIALGVMAKNQPAVQEYQTALTKLDKLREQMEHTEDRMEAVKKQMLHDRDKPVYKTNVHWKPSRSLRAKAHLDAQIISEALLGRESVLPKVFVRPNDSDDTPWSQLTEAAKAERLADSRFQERW
ncbi:MAG: MobA/MobL family protein [Schwartzia sp.]|nr:MobA/MobL family protein [Schwartzia sp. (in: firmicutes)]